MGWPERIIRRCRVVTCPSLPSLTRWWAAMERLGDRAGVRLVGVRGFAFTARRWARAGLSAFDDVQDRSSAAMAHALRSRHGGGGARPAVVPPFRLPAAGHGDARSPLDLAFSPDDRQARGFGCAIGRSQPAARRARLGHQARHAGRRDPHRRRSEGPLPGRRRQSARPRGSRASATRPISATRRIWRWTSKAGWCARPR